MPVVMEVTSREIRLPLSPEEEFTADDSDLDVKGYRGLSRHSVETDDQ